MLKSSVACRLYFNETVDSRLLHQDQSTAPTLFSISELQDFNQSTSQPMQSTSLSNPSFSHHFHVSLNFLRPFLLFFHILEFSYYYSFLISYFASISKVIKFRMLQKSLRQTEASRLLAGLQRVGPYQPLNHARSNNHHDAMIVVR